ncbi:SlyX family protein [Spongiibacter sp. KMU-158]|uniref:SlyX family protein n=1 Tax=Spongiibacter pelagi TaxID=2760804 RepID=A0A927BZ03_9GAMM|nr:SlyX family protein [Spongiibacter pelagi]MBD2858165.1 SlyX family protein [Spongiibacter pelagi]
MNDTQQQLDELQSQFAFQEDLLQALNERVVSQDREIQVLQQQLKALRELCLQLADAVEKPAGEGGSLLDERPPHY